jgi:hypothetical protein
VSTVMTRGQLMLKSSYLRAGDRELTPRSEIGA